MELIYKLGGRGEKLVRENISPAEKIIVKLKGAHGEALVITNLRLYVLKWGYMAGNTFGGRVNAYDFNRITGIEIKKGLITGSVEILTAANQNAQKGYWSNQATKSDNVISILRQTFNNFLEAVKIAREMISNETNSTNIDINNNLEAQLEKLAELRAKGLITQEEYKIKKAKLLEI